MFKFLITKGKRILETLSHLHTVRSIVQYFNPQTNEKGYPETLSQLGQKISKTTHQAYEVGSARIKAHAQNAEKVLEERRGRKRTVLDKLIRWL